MEGFRSSTTCRESRSTSIGYANTVARYTWDTVTDRIEALMNQNAIAPSSPEETRELQELLLKMLDQLPEQQKMAIVLRDLEDMPYDQMAQVLKCTEQAARLKVFRARSRLRELLEKSLRRKGIKPLDP